MKSHTHLTEELDCLVAKSMLDWHVPGLAIAVIREDMVDAKVASCPFVLFFNPADRLIPPLGLRLC